MLATVPNPVVYDGMFHVKVHCAAAAPAPCKGGVYVKVKGKGEAEAQFRVPAGQTKTVVADPAFDPGHPKGTVDVRIESGEEAPVTVTRRLVTRGTPDRPHTDYPITHVVRDRHGDGAGPLDLRRAEAHVRNHRPIITWVCWGTVTPAKMDHDVASFDANVYTRKPHSAGARRQHATAFYGDHGPVLFAGPEMGPNDWGGRFYRPSRHAIRMSIPLRRYGRRVKQLWIEPATVGTRGGYDSAP